MVSHNKEIWEYQSLLLVIDRKDYSSWHSMLAPWNKQYYVEGHWGELLTNKDKEDFIELCKETILKEYKKSPDDEYPEWFERGVEPSFDEAVGNFFYYADPDFVFYRNWAEKDDDGKWRWWINWVDNPNGTHKKCWLGGTAKFNLKENARTTPYIRYAPLIQYNPHPRASDVAYKGDIENLKELKFNSILIDDQWTYVHGKVYDYIKDLPDDKWMVGFIYYE